jgi:hypothetical protein
MYFKLFSRNFKWLVVGIVVIAIAIWNYYYSGIKEGWDATAGLSGQEKSEDDVKAKSGPCPGESGDVPVAYCQIKQSLSLNDFKEKYKSDEYKNSIPGVKELASYAENPTSFNIDEWNRIDAPDNKTSDQLISGFSGIQSIINNSTGAGKDTPWNSFSSPPGATYPTLGGDDGGASANFIKNDPQGALAAKAKYDKWLEDAKAKGFDNGGGDEESKEVEGEEGGGEEEVEGEGEEGEEEEEGEGEEEEEGEGEGMTTLSQMFSNYFN